MNELQKRMIELLNDMYQSQSENFKTHYRDHYFALLEYLSKPIEVTISGSEEIARALAERQQIAIQEMGSQHIESVVKANF